MTARSDQDFIDEEPRRINQYPLLDKIYERHDQLIKEYSEKPCLDIGFGKKPFDGATHGIDPEPKNVEEAENIEAVVGSGHDMPYQDNNFETVVAKRVIHHFKPELRTTFFDEVKRVLKPGGRFIVLEGTPGIYRRSVKFLGFKTGLLGEDNDDFGHLSSNELLDLFDYTTFDVLKYEDLGSPLMPFSLSKSPLSAKMFSVYRKTQFVKWWSLVVAERRGVTK